MTTMHYLIRSVTEKQRLGTLKLLANPCDWRKIAKMTLQTRRKSADSDLRLQGLLHFNSQVSSLLRFGLRAFAQYQAIEGFI